MCAEKMRHTNMCGENTNMCGENTNMCAENTNMCAENMNMCAEKMRHTRRDYWCLSYIDFGPIT